MTLFDKFLGRARTWRPDKTAPLPADTGAQVGATIDRALNAAGLTHRPGTGVDIRGTIDRALAQAGLASPSPDGPIATPTSRDAHGTPTTTPTGGQWLARTFRNAAG